MTLPMGDQPGERTVSDARPFTLDAERAFIGCLMHGRAAWAHGLLAGIRPDDARSPIAQAVLLLTIETVLDGIDPSPVMLLSAARNRGWLDSEHRHHEFGRWLIETYRSAPYPEAGPAMKAAMVEQALRRAVIEHAQRLITVAEHGEIHRLRVLAEPDDHLVDLWQRHADATDTGSAATITPSAPDSAATDDLSASSERPYGPPDQLHRAGGPGSANPAPGGSATATPQQVQQRRAA